MLSWMGMLTYLLIFGGIIGILVWLVVIKGNDYIVIRREITSRGTRLIRQFRAKLKKGEDNVEYLRLWKAKGDEKELPVPPQDAIDYDPKRRKKIIECWWSPEEGITYIKDTEKIKGFQPLSTKQRTMVVNQLKKKEERRKHKWTEHLPMIVGMVSLVLIIAIFIIFAGDAIEPLLRLTERLDTIIDKLNILENCQNIGGQVIS